MENFLNQEKYFSIMQNYNLFSISTSVVHYHGTYLALISTLKILNEFLPLGF